MAVITLTTFLDRLVHIVFKKQPKTGGRSIDGLWPTAGASADAARDEIVKASNMTFAATAEGDYADRHAANCGKMSRLPSESDASLVSRCTFDFWRAAGTGAFWNAHLPRLGVTVDVERTSAFRRRMTINGLPTDQVRLYAEVNKFRAAHLLYEYEAGAGVAWAGTDYEFANSQGWDERLVRDRLVAV